MLSISDLTRSYDGKRTLSFRGINLGAGGQCVFSGPSGSGKTTLLSMMAGLMRPDSGKVLVEGRDLFALSRRQRDRMRGRLFGFVFQTLHLLPSLTVKENVALASVMAGLPVDEKRLKDLLGQLGLSDKADRKPHMLSQGEAQRVAIARAALNLPKIILADEPTSALDDANARSVMEMLLGQSHDTGASLVVATHDPRIVRYFQIVVPLDRMQEAA
jgi:putative ABC transport system ATP-binding protein